MIFDKIKELKAQNKKIGITFSSFDLGPHAGHIAMLNEAKNYCDYLIAGIQTDPTIDRPFKNRPIQSIVERQIQVAANRSVDEIIIYQTEQDLIDLLCILPVDVRILGVEYKDKEFTGRQECIDRGIEIVYNSRDHKFSSSSIRQRVLDREQPKLSEKT